MVSAERQRLDEADRAGIGWRRWGPYLSERRWGTVREDASHGGDAWSSFTHDQARYRAYGWGEDGLAGVSDYNQLLCVALALWNGRDSMLKERLFELTNAEGNHGEDVKECYYYLDATPTSSCLKMLYKFLKDADGHHPVHGGQPILRNDPHWQDLPLFYEYFHGDNGAGIGASHQTGWTGIVGVLPLLFHGDVGSWVRARGRGARRDAGAAS